MPDKIPVILGNGITTGEVNNDPDATPKFIAVLSRLTHIERNAVDQVDFDAMMDRVNAMEAKLKVLEQNMFDLR